jgi:excisionase family DNA binding protein
MTLAELKTAAAEHGLDWEAVRAVYDSERAADMTAAADYRGFLETAYARLFGSTNGGHFKAANRRELSGGDYTTIPGFDETADSMVREFPTYLSPDNASAELWAAVSTPAPDAPSAAAAADRALVRALEECPAAPGSPRDMIGTAEAAALAGVSEKWIRRLVESGKLAGRRVGRSWIVSAAAAARFKRHPTAGRPRKIESTEPVPF